MIPGITTTIKMDDHGAAARLAEWPNLQKQAQARALTRTAEWARTRTVEAVVANLALKKSDLNGQHRFGGVTATKATVNHLAASVKITGGRIPLYRFSPWPKSAPTPAGIRYQIDAGGGAKRIMHNAFVAKMKSGHVGFFRRLKGTLRYNAREAGGRKLGKLKDSGQIAELWGPSIPHVAEAQPAFKKMLQIDLGERLEMQLGREVNFILTGTSKGAT